MGEISTVMIPGSNVYMVDADGDGNFNPVNQCDKGKAPQTRHDHYAVNSQPVCNNNPNVTSALANLGITKLSGPISVLRDKLLPNLCVLMHSSVRSNRAEAAYELGKLGDESAMTALMNVVENDKEDSYVRSQAIRGLALLGGKSVAPLFIKWLKDVKKDPDVRSSAARGLDEIGAKSAIPILLDVLKNDKDNWVREIAAVALGALRDESVIPEIVKVLENENEDLEVRAGIVRALTWIGGESAVSELINVFENCKNTDVRLQIIVAFSNLRAKAALPALIRVYKDKNESQYIRCWAASTLDILGYNVDSTK